MTIAHLTTPPLGALLNEFRLTRTSRLYLALWIALIGCGGLILLTAAVAAAANLFLYVLSCVLLLLGGGMTAYWFRNRQVRIQVYEHGLMYRREKPTTIMRWEDITAITQQAVSRSVNGVPIGTFYTFRLRTAAGQTLKLTSSVRNIAQLGAHIQQATYPYLLAQARAAYLQGASVSFGRLTLTQRGLELGRKTVAWDEIERIDVVNGYIRIKRRGKWFAWATLAVAKTENVYVFLTLADQLRQPGAAVPVAAR